MSRDDRFPRLLVCDAIDEAGLELLRSHVELDVQTNLSHEALLNVISDYEGVLVGESTQISKEVIEHAFHLKVIGRAGTGLENVDVVAARQANIEVVHSSDAHSLAVAEHTMALMLAAARRLPHADMSLKEGKWKSETLMGMGLAGKTLGIIGFGRIGLQVAIRAKAFGMKILVNQKRPTPELNLEIGVQAVDLNDLLEQSDFVSLHVPLKEETHNLIDAEQLALMKETAFLINTARGGVVNEEALLKALDEGVIRGAALDVFTKSLDEYNQLIQHSRVIATPNIAGSTEDAQRQAAITVAEKMIEILEGVEPFSVLPLEVVALSNIFPHESTDAKRVERLANRLKNERYLQNPPLVMPIGDKKYMVLDGATRTAAFKSLDFPHVVVQVIKNEEDLQLRTWYHVIRQLDTQALLELLNRLPLISYVETPAERVEEELFVYDGLCYVHTIDDKVYVIHANSKANRLEALNSFTEAYIEASHVSRTLDDNIISLQHVYPDMTAVVIFPEFTVQQVVHVAKSGRYVPAGITRFLISGRILRLNADLNILRSNMSLKEKNQWLHDMLQAKENAGKIRYYQEPVYLLDE